MKYIISLLFLSISLFGFDYHLKSYNMAKGVECFFGLSSTANEINGGNIINSCYIKTKKGYVVIDSGPTYSYAQQANRLMRQKEPLPVKYVINTTAEEVHILGSSFYKEQGATLLGPKEHKKYEHTRRFKLENSITKETFENTRMVPLDQYIESDKTIYVGGLKINIIKIIEKSNRYLVVHIPQRSIIFVGDMVFNNRLPSLKSGRSIVHWLKALKKIEKISWQRLISAHGVNTKYTAIKNTKSYLSILKDTVTEQILNRESKQIIIESTKMFSFMEDPLYDECHKDNVLFAYNELYQREQKNIKLKEAKLLARESEPIKQIVPPKVTTPTVLKKEPSIRYYDFPQSIKKAVATNKLLLIKIRSDNCPFCDELDTIMKENIEVKRLINKNFVMVGLNNSRDKLPLGIEVGVTPTLAFIRADTQEVKMLIPGIEALSELIETLKEGIADGHKGGYLN
ncbi:MAG: hypothetical protein KAG56_02020 [Sulfurovaceae bacterium]|nr:hypothetical protein [Sulfurovaceae bacterium]